MSHADGGAPAWRWRESLAAYGLIAAPLSILAALVLWPAWFSVMDTMTGRDGAFIGLARYSAFFADGYNRANLLFSISQTVIATAIALAISLCVALYLRFGSGPVAGFVQALSLFPLFVPSIIISYALIRFLGPNGSLQIVLENLGLHGYRSPYLTPLGPIIGFVWEAIPLPVLILTAGFAQISNDAVEAARDLGAGLWRILLEILLPQAGRAMLVAFSLTFLGIFGSYTVPYMLGPAAPEMMGVFMQRTFFELRDLENAEVQAVASFAICALVSVFYLRAMTRGRA